MHMAFVLFTIASFAYVRIFMLCLRLLLHLTRTFCAAFSGAALRLRQTKFGSRACTALQAGCKRDHLEYRLGLILSLLDGGSRRFEGVARIRGCDTVRWDDPLRIELGRPGVSV